MQSVNKCSLFLVSMINGFTATGLMETQYITYCESANIWGGSGGGLGGSVEPPKLNVKTCKKRVVKKVNQLS